MKDISSGLFYFMLSSSCMKTSRKLIPGLPNSDNFL